MLQTLKRLAILLLLPIGLFAQGINFQNFSQGTVGAAPTTTDLNASWYGTLGSGTSTSVSNSNSTLTYAATSACPDGGPPAAFHSGKFLDYSSTQGNGHNNQFVQLFFPTTPSNTTMGYFWFCSTIPATASFGTSFDAFAVICATCGSQLANYISNGAGQNWSLEGNSFGQAHIPYTPGNTVLITWMQTNGGTCVASDHSDCVRLRLYDRNFTMIGEQWDKINAGTSADELFGNINPATQPNGFHVQFSDIGTCFTGCTPSEFPLLPNVPWQGILTPGRAIDYTKAGVAGGIPSAGWSQCVTAACNTVLSAGTAATTAQINTALSSASSNTHVDIAAGTYNISTGQIQIPNTGHVALRALGNGADLIFSGSAGGSCNRSGSAFICQVDAANANPTGTPTLTWSAGYTQGATSTTISSTAGIVTTASANPTMLYYNQCDTGLSSGSGCTSGSNTDNGTLFIGDALYSAGVGCCGNGPGNVIPNRGQMEIHVASSASAGTAVLTIPLSAPNWASGQTPMVLPIQSVSMFGIENIRVKDPTVAATVGISFQNAYNWWVTGAAITDSNSHLTWGFNCLGCANGEFQSGYVYKVSGSSNPYGIRCMMCSYNLIDNNFIQQTGTPFSFDGSSSGNVGSYNFVPNATFFPSSNSMQAAFNEHAVHLLDLYEGNVAIEEVQDGIHGTANIINNFRNGYMGWWSQPLNPVNSTTNARQDTTFSRYSSDTFGLYGSSIYHTTYLVSNSCTGVNAAIFAYGQNCAYGFVPTDALSSNTALRYGDFNPVTNAVRWCGNSLNTGFGTTCASTSEAPAAAALLPNFVPVVGDTAKGQPAAPASFYLSARPSWYAASIPFPAMGPDVSGGNLGQCGGTINTVGLFAGVPSTNASKCAGQALNTLWGGHAYAIPAVNCALNVLNMPVDGSGVVLPFNAGTCYAATAPIAIFTPSSVNFGQVPAGLTSNPIPVTLQNTGTANLVVTTVSLGSAVFSLINNTCGSPATITNTIPGTGFTLTPGASCTFNAIYQPVVPNFTNTASVFFSPGASNPDALSLTGNSTGPSAPSIINFAGKAATHTLCKVTPAITQLCFAVDCGCWWMSVNGAAYTPFGVSSVNGKTGAVVLGIQ